MKSNNLKKLLPSVALVGMLSAVHTAQAIEVSVSGFIRQEMAYKINNDQNPNNPHGNPLNGKSQPNTALTHPGACGLIDVLGGSGACDFMKANKPNLTKTKLDQETDWNVFATRAEVDVSVNFTNNLTGFVKVRGYYQPDVFDDYGDTNLFSVNNHGNEATFLSISDDDYMVDLPSMYLDYAKGPLWVRVGQQQVAWGEALFFRVADMANGLDLRRHLFLDFGAEEYADERLSAPGIRASYNFGQDWELEVFAQMFQPSVLPNKGSPYSLLPYQAIVDFESGYDKVDDNWNAGVRLRGQIGDLGMQFFAISRHNPDPIIKTKPGGLTMPGSPLNGRLGDILGVPDSTNEMASTQPFTQDLTGDFGFNSAADWFNGTALAGIDGLAVLNGLIEDYDYIKDVFTLMAGVGLAQIDEQGIPSVSTIEDGAVIVDTLVTAFGAPLIAEIEVEYASENIFGLGFNYIFYAEPDTFLDQLVVRFEGSYTPDKKFTNPSASSSYISHDEWVTSLTIEKYQRFSDDFPATFFIFEWMHKSESDMLGRHLSGLGGDATHLPGNGEPGRGWDGLVFALQQPFPNLTWRLDLSVLYDLNGGVFIQPAVRYKPSGDWTIEAFANIIDANNNGSIFAPMEFSDDVTVRLTYQF